MSNKVLFIDRDGTLIREAADYQVDSFLKLLFYPHVFEYMRKIAVEFDYELVMVTNQDGLGTATFPLENFQPVHDFIMNSFKNEDIIFNKVFIDKTFPKDNAPTRKPGIGMLTAYINNPAYDLANSFVIGDRVTDMQLAKNLGCKGLWLNNDEQLGVAEISESLQALKANTISLATPDWEKIYAWLKRLKNS